MTRVDSVVGVAIALTVMGVLNLIRDWRRRDWGKDVAQFAQRFDLPLPPDATGYLTDRLRSRRRGGDVALIAVAPLLGFVVLYLGFNPPFFAALVLTVSGPPLAEIASLAVDEFRFSRRASGWRTARIVEPELDDVFPPALIWAARGFGLAPLAVWWALPHRTDTGLATALAVLVLAAALEAGERRLLSGPQTAATGLELAYDDALRVRGMLAMPALLAFVSVGAIVADVALSPMTDLSLSAWAPLAAAAAVLGAAEAPAVRLRARRRLAATAIDAEPGPVGG